MFSKFFMLILHYLLQNISIGEKSGTDKYFYTFNIFLNVNEIYVKALIKNNDIDNNAIKANFMCTYVI